MSGLAECGGLILRVGQDYSGDSFKLSVVISSWSQSVNRWQLACLSGLGISGLGYLPPGETTHTGPEHGATSMLG